jgi:hypothetical protein
VTGSSGLGQLPYVTERFSPNLMAAQSHRDHERRARAGYRAYSLRRVAAMVLRYWYLLRYSWPRYS